MYHDTLIKLKNAQQAGKKLVKIQYTSMTMSIFEVLLKRGFIARMERKGKGYKRVLIIGINEPDKGIRGLKFLSKPSRRVYVGYKDLWPVRQGYGVAVLSTPKGVMSSIDARKMKTGGELLFEVW